MKTRYTLDDLFYFLGILMILAAVEICGWYLSAHNQYIFEEILRVLEIIGGLVTIPFLIKKWSLLSSIERTSFLAVCLFLPLFSLQHLISLATLHHKFDYVRAMGVHCIALIMYVGIAWRGRTKQ